MLFEACDHLGHHVDVHRHGASARVLHVASHQNLFNNVRFDLFKAVQVVQPVDIVLELLGDDAFHGEDAGLLRQLVALDPLINAQSILPFLERGGNLGVPLAPFG